jgi:hypothetical protein
MKKQFFFFLSLLLVTMFSAKAQVSSDPLVNVNVTVHATPSTPSLSASATNILAGQSSTITAAGCSGTVNWSDGATGASRSVSPTATTTYTATCTSAAGCVSPVASLAITVGSLPPPTGKNPADPTAVPSTNPVICSGSSVALTATGCSGTYSWDNGAGSGAIVTVTPATTTTYTVTCTEPAGTSTATITVTVNPTPAAPTVAVAPTAVCSGTSATLSATGISGTLTWSDAGTGATRTVSPASTTTYTATNTSAAGCVSPAGSATLTINPVPSTPALSASATSILSGQSSTLTATGCTGTVNWSDGATGASRSVSPTATTTYTATCTSAAGCVSSAGSVTVNVGTLPAPTGKDTSDPAAVASTNPVICSGHSVALTATGCSGTYSWDNGAGTGDIVIVTPAVTTTYTVTCTTAAGTATSAITVTVNATPAAPSVPSISQLFSGESTTLTASGCSGSVSWNTGVAANAITVSPASTTTYSAVCTSAAGCPSTPKTVTIPVQAPTPSVSVSGADVCEGTNVTLTASGCSGTYNWSTGATGSSIVVATGASTSITVTCTDAAGTSAPKTIDFARVP